MVSVLDETFEPIPQVDLTYLRRHWGSAYVIRSRAGSWAARRRDDQDVITASSAEELRDLIRLDYARRPVPR